ncbi:MAG: glycosyltransferase [Proteobacteria bacterium]|nr:glycosyltransferase [Pseudomonadota bacterium]
MRIAMFTDYFFPELGGIQDSVATISRALARRGHHVDIYAPRYSKRDYRRIGAPVRERDLGSAVRVRRRASLPFPSSTRQSRAALVSPVSWARIAFEAKPDVIHTHSFFGVGLEGLLNAACLRLPVIGTNHTTIAGFGPHIPVSVKSASAYVAWFYNRCDVVTAPSSSVVNEMDEAGMRRPSVVVSNPIDTKLFRPLAPGRFAEERDELRRHFGLTRPTVTYAGRLGPEKNIGVLLRALALLRAAGCDADLAIAGHGSQEEALRALACELGIAGSVRFLGTLGQDALAELLRVSEVFAMPSTSETQSMVLVQAMASGIPVVAANARALPEFVTEANGALFDPHDAAALAGALAGLLAAPERRRALGAAGRRQAEKNDTETIADTWEALYGSVLQGNLAA